MTKVTGVNAAAAAVPVVTEPAASVPAASVVAAALAPNNRREIEVSESEFSRCITRGLSEERK